MEPESKEDGTTAVDMVTAGTQERLPQEVLTALMVGGWKMHPLWRHDDHVAAFSSSAAIYEADKEVAKRFLSPELFAAAEAHAALPPNGVLLNTVDGEPNDLADDMASLPDREGKPMPADPDAGPTGSEARDGK